VDRNQGALAVAEFGGLQQFYIEAENQHRRKPMATSGSTPKVDVSKAKLSASAESFPDTYWLTITNMNPGWTWIAVPAPGNFWVFYEEGSAPAAQIYVWHQGGSTTPINLGENNVQVGFQDMLMYQLSDPANDSIKIAYQMT
jgi:hypothetical protein